MDYSGRMRQQIGKRLLLWVMALAAVGVMALVLLFSDRLVGEGNPLPTTPEVPSDLRERNPVVAAAGDIACEPGALVTKTTCQMEETARLVAARDVDAVLVPGDIQYEDGSLEKFRQSFTNTWGEIKARLYPSPGNHEYGTPGAQGYFDYFGSRAGEQGKGYYSFDLGSWHVVALNSNCGGAGGCGGNSPQGIWLKQDLAAHPAQCTLAFWHHPRFSSGRYHPGEVSTRTFWDVLYEAGADIVLNGHDHLYERFAPMNPIGEADPELGLRQFTVGTGGRSLYQFTTVLPTSEARNDQEFGVLFLTLRDGSYDWEFAPISGGIFTDFGSGTCH